MVPQNYRCVLLQDLHLIDMKQNTVAAVLPTRTRSRDAILVSPKPIRAHHTGYVHLGPIGTRPIHRCFEQSCDEFFLRIVDPVSIVVLQYAVSLCF